MCRRREKSQYLQFFQSPTKNTLHGLPLTKYMTQNAKSRNAKPDFPEKKSLQLAFSVQNE
jgi:hypothetical protein